ncbi:hypothetical protein Q8F55_009223 [Vanrija albida]|uniref:F-box domain-containing protein n=1 Tax=Vanrija albida TaxID=181172 RepID=A0ABR3PT11_9TREE
MPSPGHDHDVPLLDSHFYPHVVDRIFDFLPLPALHTLRLVSRDFHQRANSILYRHISISFGLYANAQVIDPFERRRIPGLVLDAKVPDQFKLTIARIAAHTRIIDHHAARSRNAPLDWIPTLRQALPASILHRVDITPNRFDSFPYLAADGKALALTYRLSFDRTGHLDHPFLTRFHGLTRAIVHLALPPALDLTKHPRESVWRKVRACDGYIGEVGGEVVLIVTQGDGEPPRYTTPDGSDSGYLFDAFMSALCALRCASVVLVGLETLDPGLLGFSLKQDSMSPEDRLQLYKGVVDDWVAPKELHDAAPEIKVFTAAQFRASRGLDDYRWAVMTSGVGSRLPVPFSWTARAMAV